MKLWKKGLACLLTAALTLAVLTGCSGLGMIGTVQEDTDAAKALMQQVDSALQYDDQLEYAAQRIADWLIGEPMQLGASEGQLVRNVPLSANDTMVSDTVNDFIADAGGPWVANTVSMGMTKDNSGWATGYIYIPNQTDAVQALQQAAAGHAKMGAVYIQYGGETYVVALFL